MRKIVMSSDFGFYDSVSESDRIKMMHDAGFDGIFTLWKDNDECYEFYKLVKKLGMYFQSVHAPFDKVNVLWYDGEEGDIETERQKRCVDVCLQCESPIMTLHAFKGFNEHTPTEIGLERYSRIFDYAEKKRVTVALENTEGEEYLDALWRNFKNHKAVGFCIDTGHEMCYNGGQNIIGKYGDKLVMTHLNDNMGQTGKEITFLDDAHLLPFDGTADWKNIAERLKKAGYKGDLTFEFLSWGRPNRTCSDIYKGLTCEQYVQMAYEHCLRFAKLVDKTDKNN